jgi:twinkle protein
LGSISQLPDGSVPESPDPRIRRLAFKRLLEKVTKDPNGIDVTAYEIPEDMHLLRSPMAFVDDVAELLKDQTCKGDKMPALKTHGSLQFRPHEVTVWFGYKSSYKSVFLNELFTYWASQGKVVCIASFEMPAKKLVALAVRQALAKETPTWDDVFRALDALSKGGLVVYDVMGRVAPKHLLAVMNYCAQELGCQHFLVDNLTDLLPVGNDHSDQHQRFAAGCLTISRATGMHIHLVAHCAKPERGDVSKPPTGYSIRGTGAVPDMVENLVAVWRNIHKEDELLRDDLNQGRREELRREADVVLLVDKQKFWDYRGAINFWIDRRCLRFREGGFSECDPFV